MSLGHVGKWFIQTYTGSTVSQAQLNVIEKQGYEIVSIAAYDSNGNSPTTIVYARYRGGMRSPSGG